MDQYTAVMQKPMPEKGIDVKRVYWAIGAQVLFAIFLIIAFYGIGYAFKSAAVPYLKSSNIDFSNITLSHLNDYSYMDSTFTTSWNLGIAAVVFAFATILVPCSSLLFRNKNDSKIINYTMISLDVIALILSIASTSVMLQELTVSSDNELITYIRNNNNLVPSGWNNSQVANTIKGFLGSSAVYNPGYAAGMFIFIFAGYGLALGSNFYAYKGYFKLMF